jgi:cysteinyl-tRNA synthetase
LRRVPPSAYFREASEYAGKYGRFDAKGFPTHDADGKELTSAAAKKLKKKWEKHKKEHAAYLAEQGGAK